MVRVNVDMLLDPLQLSQPKLPLLGAPPENVALVGEPEVGGILSSGQAIGKRLHAGKVCSEIS